MSFYLLCLIICFFLIAGFICCFSLRNNVKKLKIKQENLDDRLKELNQLFDTSKNKIAAKATNFEQELSKIMEDSRKKLEKKIQTDFEDACSKINFKGIEYKQTITKRRREYSKKNSKSAKPKRIWRKLFSDEDEDGEKEDK